jgi:XamI restriction endonuclease
VSGAWPAHARRWSDDELRADAAAAVAEFRARRLGEPLARYLAAFDASREDNAALISRLGEVLGDDGGDSDVIDTLWASESGRTAFRYLGAPPISQDDLETLAEAKLAVGSARASDGKRNRLIAVMRAILDPRRFPWIVDARSPTSSELHAAVLATTSLMASQRVQTLRRGDEKSMVEGAVKGLLVGMGWGHAAARPAHGIQNLLNDSPPAKTFLTQVNLGSDNADVVVRLHDGRLLAIECKGSNSEINSRKRLNKEAVQNARAWLARFGDQVVPAVALQGVFKDRYLVEAQHTPMLIFWGHRLDDLVGFIEAAR